MTADTLKSASITNLDTIPALTNTAGEGGLGLFRNISDYVTATAAGLADTGSKYKVVRLPTNAKIKAISVVATADLDTNVSPLLAIDVGAYYSDATNDGTLASNQGTAISTNCFGAAVLFASHTGLYRKVDGLAAYSVDKRNQALWLALGLATDPGGEIDVVVAVNAAAATAAAGKIGVSVDYVI